jgi:hypothetical protein
MAYPLVSRSLLFRTGIPGKQESHDHRIDVCSLKLRSKQLTFPLKTLSYGVLEQGISIKSRTLFQLANYEKKIPYFLQENKITIYYIPSRTIYLLENAARQISLIVAI